MAGKPARSRVGTFSRASAVRNVDGRTVEARILREVVHELTDQLGGPDRVTPAQRLLIAASATIALRLRCATERYTTGVGDVESLDRHVASLANSLRLNLVALGLERRTAEAPTLASYLELRARKEAA